MGIRFCSYSVYGLGYCPTMSWSAIVNSVCDTYTLFATRLRFDLYTFWDIFGRVWFLEFCVQQFWACKFTVSLCLLLLVRRREAKRVEAKWDEESWRELKRREEFESVWLDDIFLVILWRSLWRHQVLLYGDGADVRSYCRVRRLVWLTTKLLCVECVAVSTIAPVCHTKELCRVDLSQRSVMDRSSSVV